MLEHTLLPTPKLHLRMAAQDLLKDSQQRAALLEALLTQVADTKETSWGWLD